MNSLPLNKVNRLKLARAFRRHTRVDMGIDCAIEGQMGEAFADDAEEPTVFLIELDGFFAYLAGDAQSAAARKLVAALKGSKLFMTTHAGAPWGEAWAALLKELHGDRVAAVDRHRFSSETVTTAHLDGLLRDSAHRQAIRRLDVALTRRLSNDAQGWMDVGAYESVEDFVARSAGYCVLDGDEWLGVAYGSLVCSRGIEVSIVVHPDHRRRGVATALGAALLRDCLEHDMDANWDAANEASCNLASKLGYEARGSYVAHFLRG